MAAPLPWRQRAPLAKSALILLRASWGLLLQTLRSAFRRPRSAP